MRGPALRSIAAAAIVVIAAAAPSFPAVSRAASVRLWACHGPAGEALSAAPLSETARGDGRALPYGRGCEGPAGTGGLSATFADPEPAGGSLAVWRVAVPAGVELQGVRIARQTSGFGGAPVSGDPQFYEAAVVSATGTASVLELETLEDFNRPLGGELIAPAGGRLVRLGVGCGLLAGERCAAGPVGVEVSSIALEAVDMSPPVGSVGGVANTVAPGQTLHLLLSATDDGLGLASAEASLDGRTVAYARLGSGACPEHPAAEATIDLPLGAPCPEHVWGVPLAVPVGAAGSHQLRVSVTDAAGTTTALLNQTIQALNPPPPLPNTVTIGIGNPHAHPEPHEEGKGGGNGGHPGEGGRGGVRGSTSKSEPCRSPMLSMHLASRPLRYRRVHRRRVPVLRAGRRYRYRGALTCLPAGSKHRVSAPNGTVVHVLYRIKRRTRRAGRGTMTVHRGRLSALLGYRSSRTIVFRYRTGGGETVQVKIPTAIARRHGKRGRHRRR